MALKNPTITKEQAKEDQKNIILQSLDLYKTYH